MLGSSPAARARLDSWIAAATSRGASRGGSVAPAFALDGPGAGDGSPRLAERRRGSGRQTPHRTGSSCASASSLWHHLHDADEVLCAVRPLLLQLSRRADCSARRGSRVRVYNAVRFTVAW